MNTADTVPAALTFIATFAAVLALIAPLCIILGICGWLSDRITLKQGGDAQ